MTGSDSSDRRIVANTAELVLASTSRYRAALLERLGIPFRTRSPVCDESVLKSTDKDPVRLARALALQKAASLRKHEPSATIIGADQVLSFQGQIFGKPMTAERAIDQLASLSGQTHQLITSLIVLTPERTLLKTEVATLHMRQLTRPEIERYVAAEEPLDCAGSYKVESRGISLFERIESHDQTAIIGLPLIALVSILRELGYEIP